MEHPSLGPAAPANGPSPLEADPDPVRATSARVRDIILRRPATHAAADVPARPSRRK